MHVGSARGVGQGRTVVHESRLEGGGNRANRKFTNFKHNYKPRLVLELNSSPKERAKTNHKQIRRMTR
jgi:hypothetical protein